MDTLKAFFDLLKTNAYELLAIFLPGAAVLEVLRKTFRGVEGVAHTWLADRAELKYLALSYAVGIALQGLARRLTGSKKFREEFTEKTTARSRSASPL